MQILANFGKLIWLTANKWSDDNISWLSAALAYYTLFSLAPTFIVVILVFGSIFGEEAVKGQIVVRIQDIVGLDTAKAIQGMIEAGQSMVTLSWANLLGIAAILFAATNVFTHLKRTLNQIWEVPSPPRNWMITLILHRLSSFMMLLSIGVILAVLVILEVGVASTENIIQTYLPQISFLHGWKITNLTISFVIISTLFALIYKIIPDVDIQWKDVFGGAALASFLFTAGKFLIALFLSRSRTISVFGAASSFIVILVWVYISAQILLFGAAFSHHYAKEWGSQKGKKKME